MLAAVLGWPPSEIERLTGPQLEFYGAVAKGLIKARKGR